MEGLLQLNNLKYLDMEKSFCMDISTMRISKRSLSELKDIQHC